MSNIQEKIHQVFPDLSIFSSKENDSLFAGRNLPSFVKHFILLKYTDEQGKVDEIKVKEYLDSKMPTDTGNITTRLMSGESINMTTRFVVTANVSAGKMEFSVPDAQIRKDAIVSPTLLDELHQQGIELTNSENWGNITIQQVPPEGKRKGYLLMTGLKLFRPYAIDLNYFFEGRRQFTTEEWMDVIIASMGYNPTIFASVEQKHEFISRLIPFVEANLNMIELGPKGTGKSFVYNNFSKYVWMISGGNTSRARLFYNKTTKQYGLIKKFDAVALDELESFEFADPQEMQSIMKGFLEAGKANVDEVTVQSTAGLSLMGNIPLTEDMQPRQSEYFRNLPGMFQESATMDRFHAFLEGWKLPRLTTGAILQGWTLNAEYLSTIFHQLRFEPAYEKLFDELVGHAENADLRDLKAVCKVATAYSKLLFPHVTSLDDILESDRANFLELYKVYCLEPAIRRRGIIRQQCHLIDPEFHAEMPEFFIKVELTPLPDAQAEPMEEEELPIPEDAEPAVDTPQDANEQSAPEA